MISEKRLLATFLELIRINAPARCERPVAQYLKKKLKSFSVREDGAAKAIGGNCGNLIVCVKGDRRRPVMLSAHMDTVRPTTGIQPRLEKGIFRTDGKTILGADDRAGIAMILELIAHLGKSNIPHPPLELVFTVAEEIGLQGAKQMRGGDLKASMGYVLDSSLPIGTAVHRAVSIQRMDICVKGRAAHAGVNPERGVNAIAIAAEALSQIPTGRIAPLTSLNVGTIRGGYAFNIVPSEVRTELEIRSAAPKVLKKWTRHVENAFVHSAKRFHGKVQIKSWIDFRSFTVSGESKVAQGFRSGARAIGLKPVLCQYGGGSDANVFNRMGIPSLVLGLGYELPHTNQESIPLENLVRGTRLLAAILEGCP